MERLSVEQELVSDDERGQWPFTILASTPDADIIEVGDFGCRVAWADLAITDHWRRYLADPSAYLRHLIDP